MLPLINVFGFEVQSYSVIAFIGFVVTALVAVNLGKSRGILYDTGLSAILVSVIGIFFGAHFLFALTNMKYISELAMKGEVTLESLKPFVNGMVFYGGLFGAAIALYIYCKIIKDAPKGNLFDVFAVSVPLFHVFGRVGCFFAGCCYGVESDFGITVNFKMSAEHYSVSRFPVQLVEALINLIIFAILLYCFKRNKAINNLFYIYLVLYAPSRFVLEFFRGDEVRGLYFGFSTSQIISLLIILFLIVYSGYKFIKNKSRR